MAEIRKVGVVGLGTMGAGIAQVVVQAGLEVVRDELETMVEPEGEVRWQWLLARRPSK